MGARRHPGGLQRQAAARGLGALPRAHDQRVRSRPRPRGLRGHQPRQRARGVHSRRRVHPRRVRRARLLGRGRLLRARPRRRGRDGSARRRVDRRGSPEPRRLGDGLAPLRPALPQPRLHARAHVRDLFDLLRHQVPGPGAARRPAAQALADLRAAPGARRVVRGEVGLGARELVRAQRGERGRRASGRAAGPGRSGLPRSEPSTGPAARPPRSSTRPPSRRSTSSGPARPTSSSTCATTGSPATWARSRTRRC